LPTESDPIANHIQGDDRFSGKMRAKESIKTPQFSLFYQVPASGSPFVLKKMLDCNRK
jgi:hypothetical protein